MKPLLAPMKNPDINKLQYPVMVSPKMDGIRCIITGSAPYTRSMKSIANEYIYSKLKGITSFEIVLDGELIVGEPYGNDVFNRTTSGVMTIKGEPEFTYWVFDIFDNGFRSSNLTIYSPYKDRYESVLDEWEFPYIKKMPTVMVNTPDELRAHEEFVLEQGFEGLMIRNPKAGYKFGRATAKENIIYKYKRYDDGEATIVSLNQAHANKNQMFLSELGYTKRSTHKDNMVAKPMVGSFNVIDIDTSASFAVGTGINEKLAKEIYNADENYIGKIIKYKCAGFTPDGKPRFPVFMGFRDLKDL